MTELGLLAEEFRLAREMKEKYCDEAGKEIESTKTGEIIHHIGRIYRSRSPDKISLIQSVGLFNAAIVRNPPNISQIKSELDDLCAQILQLARARNQKENLVKKSEQVKASIIELRNEVDDFLENSVPKIPTNIKYEKLEKLKTRKISAIRHLNKIIAEKYKKIMAQLSKYCEYVMMQPPCNYAVVGLSSLAREEITHYSDFEHIILLSDDMKSYYQYLEYFRWFSVIFHVIILNMQETIRPGLCVTSLNNWYDPLPYYLSEAFTQSRNDFNLGNWFYDDITTPGISFDRMMPHACKFPLGRTQGTKYKPFTTELIKPVSEMLDYLTYEQNLKNGYHLAEILTQSCFVFGNEHICQEFNYGVQKHQTTNFSTVDATIDETWRQKEDLNFFSARSELIRLKAKTFHSKRVFYRTSTLFIGALGRMNGVFANSSFDILDGLVERKKISRSSADKLRYAVAIACEIRLRIHMQNKSQKDVVSDRTKALLDINIANTVRYFQIAYSLQCEVAKQANISEYLFTDPNQFNSLICSVFEIPCLPRLTKTTPKHFWDVRKFNFDRYIEELEKGVELNPSLFQKICYHFDKHGINLPKFLDIGIYILTGINFDVNSFASAQCGVRIGETILRSFKKNPARPSFPLSADQITNISKHLRAGYVL